MLPYLNKTVLVSYNVGITGFLWTLHFSAAFKKHISGYFSLASGWSRFPGAAQWLLLLLNGLNVRNIFPCGKTNNLIMVKSLITNDGKIQTVKPVARCLLWLWTRFVNYIKMTPLMSSR